MKRFLSITLFSTLFAMMFQSCTKESNNQELPQAQVEFTFSGSLLKTANEQVLTNVVVTIEDLQGNLVKNSEKIELYNMNGNYISKPISLLTGDYKLSRFMVLDASNNVVYASPLVGSVKAYLVEKPLPIEFTAQKDLVTKLTPEVLSTFESVPEDFGYATFSFEIIKTFDFLVGAFVYNDVIQNFELTTAAISIYSNDILVYSDSLLATANDLGITNKITLPEKYNTFIIEISKDGYNTYNKAFTKEELRLQYRKEDKGPLVVILSKNEAIPGLVAYYPFNGNANDESGYGKHGTDYGASGYNVSIFNLARTFTNDPTVGVNATDYVTIPNVINSEEFTVNLWAQFQYKGNHQTLLYLTAGTNWTSSNFFFDVSPDMKLAVILNGLDLRTIDYSHAALLNMQFSDAYINSKPLELNKYYNITCTFKNSVVTLYVDGAEYAKYLNVNRTVGSPNVPIKLGVCLQPGLLYYPLVGQMDELRFFDRAINGDEIIKLFNYKP